MGSFLKVFFRYIPNYRFQLVLYIIFTMLGAICNVFSFSAIIPILNVLFGVSDASIQLKDLSEASSVKDLVGGYAHNVLYYLQEMIQNEGAGYVLLLSCAFLIVTIILKNAFTYMSSFYRAPIRHGIAKDMRHDLFSKIIKLPVGFFTQAYKGDVLSRITSDIIEVNQGIKVTFNLLIRDAINIIVPFITIVAISGKLTAMALVALPLYVLFFNCISKLVQKHTLKAQNMMGVNLSLFDEMMGGLRVIKSFATETRYEDAFDAQNTSTMSQYVLRNRIADLAYPLSEIIMTIIVSAILWFGGRMVLDESIALSGSVFIYYLVVFFSMVSPIMSATDAFFGIRQSVACIQRLNYVFDYDTTNEDCPKATSDLVHISSVQLNDVDFCYSDSKTLLSQVNMTFETGHVYAVTGSSGVGKTTLMDLLFRFHEVSKGDVVVNGMNVKDWNVSQLRISMAYVNQDTYLFNSSVYDNLTLGDTSITKEEILNVTKRIGIHDFISTLPNGYDTILGDRGSLLSGGQKQCISIARALVRNKSLLILDEATSALDLTMESFILNAVREIMKDGIVILISHNANVTKFADKEYILES